jgi:hypothetical protein
MGWVGILHMQDNVLGARGCDCDYDRDGIDRTQETKFRYVCKAVLLSSAVALLVSSSIVPM